ncbi:hypothetical protein GGX14DRAFT_609857 [Mycena pura]|uniref:Uncharacterized protein n=1 Tax=Mycena pura TaxID=153505 RepID=A0AAD6YJC5_9AGAR|nr:hypothetical protein GGX14DRAFT_609857 [Mycena pura]
MPISFSVANHPAETVIPKPHRRLSSFTAEKIRGAGLTGEEVFRHAIASCRNADKLLQFSLGNAEEFESCNLDARFPNLIPSKSGFVHTVIKAYSDHHNLVIRPDDVWLSIVCQFSFFVNANAEVLRANFVAHEGKKELVVRTNEMAFGEMANKMADLVEKNVVDPSLRAWALPAFTTTNITDTTVAAILLMATVKQYFKYRHITGCGIPRVTLEGERADWVDILGRLEKLKEYGIETIAWYHLLRPVILRFVAAFDNPQSKENIAFWSKVAHHDNGSGMQFYSGWINAFNVFSRKGEWLGRPLNTELVSRDAPETMTAGAFWAAYAKEEDGSCEGPRQKMELTLDGTSYHHLDTFKVPDGYAEVDVVLEDGSGVETECTVVAGMVGMQAFSGSSGAEKEKDDTLRPVAGWWAFSKKSERTPVVAGMVGMQVSSGSSRAGKETDDTLRPVAAFSKKSECTPVGAGTGMVGMQMSSGSSEAGKEKDRTLRPVAGWRAFSKKVVARLGRKQASSSKAGKEKDDTLRPVAGWWAFSKKSA